MSFVPDLVRRVDAQLDRLQLRSSNYAESLTIEDGGHEAQASSKLHVTKYSLALQTAIRALSPSDSDSRTLLRPYQITALLAPLSEHIPSYSDSPSTFDQTTTSEGPQQRSYDHDLEWLLVSKATTQAYGLVLTRILNSAVSISDDLWYWEGVLGSRRATAWYGVQIAPGRVWEFSRSVWDDVNLKRIGRKAKPTEGEGDGGEEVTEDDTAGVESLGDTFAEQWRKFYGLVRQVIVERSAKELNKKILGPVSRIRAEVRVKQAALGKLRTRNANALGLLLGEGLAKDSAHGPGHATPAAITSWRESISKNVALIEAVLVKITELDSPIDKFDGTIGDITQDDPLYATNVEEVTPQAIAERLSRVLTLGLPQYGDSSRALVQQHGRPSRIVRYWLPVTIGVLSSSTILRLLVNRQAEAVQWVEDLGATIVDFWRNWVVEPLRNVIKTIRHDEGSEISIMSKRSLQGDRDSLERMVVDFAVDNPANATGSNSKLTEADIADIRARVREGDLTPVLRAYEKDLASPLLGAVRGNLIRALLIQIQKTKVDVEVAMGGIDALLKSQELLIGFISLTPGLLVAYGSLRWLRASFSDQRGTALRRQGIMLRQLRNIDRILGNSTPNVDGELSYKDQGLLLCEIHVLRQQAQRAMPDDVFREFGEDLEELCDVRTGIDRQVKVVNRIRWAYGKWLA